MSTRSWRKSQLLGTNSVPSTKRAHHRQRRCEHLAIPGCRFRFEDKYLMFVVRSSLLPRLRFGRLTTAAIMISRAIDTAQHSSAILLASIHLTASFPDTIPIVFASTFTIL